MAKKIKYKVREHVKPCLFVGMLGDKFIMKLWSEFTAKDIQTYLKFSNEKSIEIHLEEIKDTNGKAEEKKAEE